MRLQSVETGQHCRNRLGREDTLKSVIKADLGGTASYIADLSEQLARMAKEAKLDLPAYLLEMASLEARRSSSDTSRSD